MSSDDEARARRAAELREQIRKLETETEPDDDGKEPESPRDFIHRKMREESEEEKKD